MFFWTISSEHTHTCFGTSLYSLYSSYNEATDDEVYVFPPYFCHWIEKLTHIQLDGFEHQINSDTYAAIRKSVDEDKNHKFPDQHDKVNHQIYRYKIIRDFLHELQPRAITLTQLLSIHDELSECYRFMYCASIYLN